MENSPAKNSIHVLAIDDERGLRDMLAFGLPIYGYRVTTAANGAEALQKARETPFELAVCDIMMPGQTGIEVLAELKKISPQTEVVIATGQATIETAIEAMKLGAYDYITKPYSVKQLIALFERALERRNLKSRIGHLEELDKLKTQFLANTSHELRTPLNVIMGFHALLLNDIYGPLQQQQKDIITRTDQSVKGLLRLVSNLLDLSQLSAGHMEAMPKRCDLAQLVKEAITELQPLAVEQKLTLQCEIPGSLPCMTDANRVNQMLINLIVNGLKFTSAGGVTVRLEKRENPALLSLSVTDTGIGIEAKDFPRLFEEFHQIDPSSTRRYGGTGLGLSICKRMADLLGGRIEVQSQVGQGSTFTIVLPYVAAENQVDLVPVAEPTAAEPPENPFKKTASGTILIADDDANTRRVYRDVLTGAGYRVQEAPDGASALKMVSQDRPDLLLLDLSMPELAGWDVARQIRKDPTMAPLKIVSFSVHAAEGEALKALEAGCDAHITKPCEPAEVLRRIAQCLKQAA